MSTNNESQKKTFMEKAKEVFRLSDIKVALISFAAFVSASVAYTFDRKVVCAIMFFCGFCILVALRHERTKESHHISKEEALAVLKEEQVLFARFSMSVLAVGAVLFFIAFFVLHFFKGSVSVGGILVDAIIYFIFVALHSMSPYTLALKDYNEQEKLRIPLLEKQNKLEEMKIQAQIQAQKETNRIEEEKIRIEQEKINTFKAEERRKADALEDFKNRLRA